jgi:hypothetical protein
MVDVGSAKDYYANQFHSKQRPRNRPVLKFNRKTFVQVIFRRKGMCVRAF